MTTATETCCDHCDEVCDVLTQSPLYDDQMVCSICYDEHAAEVEADRIAAAEEARQEALDDAQGEIDEAEAEIDSILEEMAELKERLVEARKAAKDARKRLDALNA